MKSGGYVIILVGDTKQSRKTGEVMGRDVSRDGGRRTQGPLISEVHVHRGLVMVIGKHKIADDLLLDCGCEGECLVNVERY